MDNWLWDFVGDIALAPDNIGFWFAVCDLITHLFFRVAFGAAFHVNFRRKTYHFKR